MTHDHLDHYAEPLSQQTLPSHLEAILPRLRSYFTTLPEVRLAYLQMRQFGEQLSLSGPDRTRVMLAFSRNVSGEHIEKRLAKIRKHFTTLLTDEVDFVDIDQIDYREACAHAFNSQVVYGTPEAVERDQSYRYNIFLEWNAGKRLSGVKQVSAALARAPSDRPMWVVSVPRFIAPIYHHLKMIEGHMSELQQLLQTEVTEFMADSTLKSLAESYMLKGIQSTILITMSIMHRKIRLSARDYRDLFLLMPVYGISTRDRAVGLAQCADIRDRLVSQYEEVTAAEVHQQSFEVVEILQDFKTFVLEWLFDHFYGQTGELIQGE